MRKVLHSFLLHFSYKKFFDFKFLTDEKIPFFNSQSFLMICTLPTLVYYSKFQVNIFSRKIPMFFKVRFRYVIRIYYKLFPLLVLSFSCVCVSYKIFLKFSFFQQLSTSHFYIASHVHHNFLIFHLFYKIPLRKITKLFLGDFYTIFYRETFFFREHIERDKRGTKI